MSDKAQTQFDAAAEQVHDLVSSCLRATPVDELRRLHDDPLRLTSVVLFCAYGLIAVRNDEIARLKAEITRIRKNIGAVYGVAKDVEQSKGAKS